MIFAQYAAPAVKRPTALRLGTNSPSFQLFERDGVMGWTNNDMMDFGVPKFVRDRVLSEYGELSRAPTLNTITVDRLIGRYADKADRRLSASSFELQPHSFANDPTAPNPLARDSVVLVNDQRQLATRVDLRYFGYFLQTYRHARFFAMDSQVANGSLAGAVAVVQAERLVGLVSPFMCDGYGLFREVEGALQSKEVA